MAGNENNYYLKEGLLYKITGSSMYRVSVEDVINDSNKSALLIDDLYFFYVGMEHVSTSAKKLNAIAGNYLNILFPQDMLSSYGVFQYASKTVIYIINSELISIIAEHNHLFAGFKKISTPFLEFCIKYNDFIFSDSIKQYRLAENMVSVCNTDESETISAKDLFDSLESIKYNIALPGVTKKSAFNLPIVAPAVVLSIIYIVFIISSSFEISAYNKINKYYEDALQKVYTTQGVASAKDPYGSLLQQSKSVTGGNSSQRIISILNDLSGVSIKGISFNDVNIRDNDIKVTGTATDFAQVDELKKIMENKLQKSVNVDDTKKTKDGISFTMKYEKK